jgi:hypothetical protein
MVKVTESKNNMRKYTINPKTEPLDMVLLDVCKGCFLYGNRKTGTYNKMDDMNYCVGCAADIKKKHSTGEDFEVLIVTPFLPKCLLKAMREEAPLPRVGFFQDEMTLE